jgi:L-seryl-tRNA(Ser) seleniumtransferase
MTDSVLIDLIRRVITDSREGGAMGSCGVSADVWIERVSQAANTDLIDGPRPVINATGTVLHTNLGRAPLSQAAVQAMTDAAGYNDLEHDLDSGRRITRQAHVEPLLNLLLGSEASMMVANNAAAILLTLTATAGGREVVISRGQAVEIGEGFRLPTIVRQSHSKMVEVGTTNRTRIDDYAAAVSGRTSAFLHVHSSNFKIIGFTEQVAIGDLASEAHRHGVLLLVDNGSGALVDTSVFGLEREPMPKDALAADADVVTFSTDKLLGGPQGGVIAGRRDVIERIRRHPLARAVRPDKTAIAALAATLRQYVAGDLQSIPVLAMLGRSPAELGARARSVASILQAAGWDSEVEPGESTVGGGSLPGQTLPSVVVAIRASRITALARRMRALPVPVIPRVQSGRLLLDMRTVLPEQDGTLVAGLLTVTLKTAGQPAVPETAS